MAQVFDGGGHTHTVRARLGAGQEGPRLALMAEESTQTSSLGLPLDVDDGSVYRYSHYVAGVAAGKVAATDISLAGFAAINGKFTDSAGTAADQAAAATLIYMVDTGTFQSENDAANVWAGGYLYITSSEDVGYFYRIKEHTQPEVAPTAVSGLIRFTLHDPLVIAVDSESGAAVLGHPYKNLIIATTTDILVAGIPRISTTAAYFAWTQTWGWANVLADESAGTIAAGTLATLSDSVSGAAQPMGGASFNSQDDIALALVTEPILGHFGFAAVDVDYTPIFLKLNP